MPCHLLLFQIDKILLYEGWVIGGDNVLLRSFSNTWTKTYTKLYVFVSTHIGLHVANTLKSIPYYHRLLVWVKYNQREYLNEITMCNTKSCIAHQTLKWTRRESNLDRLSTIQTSSLNQLRKHGLATNNTINHNLYYNTDVTTCHWLRWATFICF